MITLIVALGLSASAAQAQPVAPTRKAYASCLTKYLQKATTDRLAADAFEAALKTACTAEETAFRQAIVADDMKRGTKRADAEEGAQLQIDDYLANTRDGYQPPEA